MEFLAWYFGHLVAAGKNAWSLQKSVGEWIILALLIASLGVCGLSWVPGLDEEASKWLKMIAPGILFVVVVVFGPLWFAFKETKSLTEQLAKHPSATISSLMLDTKINRQFHGANGVFCFELVNGAVPMTPCAQIVRIDGYDKPLEHSFEAHWRGKKSRILKPGEVQQFGLVGAVNLPNGLPTLFLWDNDNTRFLLTGIAPLRDQKAITLKVNIICEFATSGSSGNEVKILSTHHFTIVPDPTSEIKYKVQ